MWWRFVLLKSMIAGAVMAVLLGGSALAGSHDDGLAAYNRGDYVTAFKVMWPLAGQGDVVAMYTIASMFENGLGVPRDAVEAVRWYRAALDGVPPAPQDAALRVAKGQIAKD